MATYHLMMASRNNKYMSQEDKEMSTILNAAQILENINNCIAELEGITDWRQVREHNGRIKEKGYSGKMFVYNIRKVCNELSIFDWWNETLSKSQLKDMKKFVETAISLGFTGYVCFKVGAVDCANGMWAYTDESTDGYSPKTGNALYHSFVSNENYWDLCIDGKWQHGWDNQYKISDIKRMLQAQ